MKHPIRPSSAAVVFLLVIVAPISLQATSARVTNGKIAFVSDRDGNREIYVMNADGTDQTRLTNNTVQDSDPAWSPDGSKIAFSTFGNMREAIAVMNANGTGNHVLLKTSDSQPAWSPDGQSIAFVSKRDGNLEIYVTSIGSGIETRLTANSAVDMEPAWSPDGRRLVFTSYRDGHPEVYVMNTDGSDQTRLTVSSNAQAASFSPDGTKIVYQQTVFTPEIFVMNADGSNQVQLTKASNSHAPAFSPDGKKIVFYGDVDSYEIFTMNADGSGKVQLMHNPFEDAVPAWQQLFLPTTAGVYRPTNGQWLLRSSNSPGPADITVTFGGQPGDLPVTGDWNGDGTTDIGIFRSGSFLLATIERTQLCAVCPSTFHAQAFGQNGFGQPGDRPIAGDWDGDGDDDVGVYRDGTAGAPSRFLLRKLLTPNSVTTITHTFGQQGDLPLVGDWDGDGTDSIGVFHPDTAAFFLLTNDFSEAQAGATFGTIGDLPIAGDWSAAGHDRVGVFHPSTATMSLATQLFAAPDINFNFGAAGDIPVAGHWIAVP
jgi:Tol biopolymer transport system component